MDWDVESVILVLVILLLASLLVILARNLRLF